MTQAIVSLRITTPLPSILKSMQAFLISSPKFATSVTFDLAIITKEFYQKIGEELHHYLGFETKLH